MKKIFLILFLILFAENSCFANCDWKTGITPGPNHTFIYTESCHLAVGQLVSDSAVKDKQISDLTTALDLKNAALVIADQRTALWEKTSDDQLMRLNTMQADQHHDNTLAFALGVATTFLAAYAAGQIIHR
jgi:hypothetical protein